LAVRNVFHILFSGIAFLAAFAVPWSADAQDLVVTRNVTVRANPLSTSPRLHFPAIGERLVLLDDGRQERGYYHVRLGDGRVGWVYRTYVKRADEFALESADTAPSGPDQVKVHYIDVDQGNATLVEFPCAAILIDAGGRDPVATGLLTRYLDSFFARRTDLQRRLAAVYVTHTHVDHNTALGALVYNYKIGAYIDNGRLFGSGSKDAVWMAAYIRDVTPAMPRAAVLERDVRASGGQGLAGPVIDPVACPGVDPQIRVLTGGRERSDNSQWSKDDYDNGNNHSVVIRIDYGKASFLFPGDLENAGIADALTRYAETGLLDTDVVEVSHHGADNGTTAPFLAAISPDIAVISMGPEGVRQDWSAYQYGHPRIASVRLLRDAVHLSRPAKHVRVANAMRSFETMRMDKAVFGTGWDGTVIVTADAQGRFAVKTEH